jgi:hypothetical protein
MSVAVAFAYMAAVVVVELSLACLCSKLRFVVEPQYQDVNTVNKETSPCPGCCPFPTAKDLESEHPLCMVRSGVVIVAVLLREGFRDEVANAKER